MCCSRSGSAGAVPPAVTAIEAKFNSSPMLSVADFLPVGYAKDGSVSYQAEIQKAIDAARDGRTLVFPPMVYRLDESGLRLGSRLTLWMYGAVFRLDEQLPARTGRRLPATDVDRRSELLGGEIVGRNDVWPEGVNIRGIYLTGPCEQHPHP